MEGLEVDMFLPRHIAQMHCLARGETRELTIEGMAIANGIAEAHESQKSSSHRRKFKAKDLVLIRDFQLDKDHGRKLEPRWTGPRVLIQAQSCDRICNT
jgi:hypothetical protein